MDARLNLIDDRPGPAAWLPRADAQIASEDGVSAERQRMLILLFLALGIAGRCLRYVLKFPLWEDEAFLCVNFIDRGFAQVLQPLAYHQVAPPLFLWTELAVTRLFGFSEYSLRLIPFLCSVGGLLLFHRLASALLRGWALVFAVAIFAVSYSGIRYAAEAKQYSTDLFAALVLLNLAVAWWRGDHGNRPLWIAAALMPVAVGLSYTAVFVAGGISLFLALVIWRERRAAWKPWIAFNGLLVASFLAVFLTTARNQSSAELDFMQMCWGHTFPPMTEPWRLPGWLISTHAGVFFGYPLGGDHGGSALTLLYLTVAVVVLARRREGRLLALLLSPFAVQFAAAAVRRYPYGGHVKFSQPLAPAICLLMGFGLAYGLNWARRGDRGRAWVPIALGLLACVGVGTMVRDVANPYKTLSDERARAFAQYFWFTFERDHEVLCLELDVKGDMAPSPKNDLSWSATYLCNRRIYSPAGRRNPQKAFRSASRKRPLLCTIYRDERPQPSDAAVSGWLKQMKEDFELTEVRSWPFPRYDKRDRVMIRYDHMETFEFVPRRAPAGKPQLSPTSDVQRVAAPRERMIR